MTHVMSPSRSGTLRSPGPMNSGFTWSHCVMIAPDRIPPNPFGRGILNRPSDYVPKWDVPSIGKEATDRLLRAIRSMRVEDRVDPDRKIQILLGASGFGKTHLFGRIAHTIGQEVLFVFVP